MFAFSCVFPSFSAARFIVGFALELHTRFQKVRDRFRECEDNAEECFQRGKGISDVSLFRHPDTHSLIAYVTCADIPNSSAETTPLEHQEPGGENNLDDYGE